MKSALIICLLLVLAGPGAAQAKEDILIKLTLKSVDRSSNPPVTRSAAQTVRLREGGSAQVSMASQGNSWRLGQTWNFKALTLAPQRIRLESLLEVRVGTDGPSQRSKIATTLVEGEPWEASIDSASGDATLDYRITVWHIPDGYRFLKFDGESHPMWVKGKDL